MRIHTNLLSASDLYVIMNAARDNAPNVHIMIDGTHGSRSHKRAYEVKLRGNGARHTRRPNSGTYGAADGYDYAATWDDWGHFLAALYVRDSLAKAGPYKNAGDFHQRTKYRFARCEFCRGTESVTETEDPYASEIYNDDTPVMICDRCYAERADEV